MTPKEILEKAAELIEYRGWHQGAYMSTTGCLCADGAMLVAAFGSTCAEGPLPNSEAYGEAYLAACAVVETGVISYRGIIAYNDSWGMTQDRVVAKLRGAARLAATWEEGEQ